MGTHLNLRVLSECFQMNTNMTGFRCFKKNLCVLVLWTEVASAWEGLNLSITVESLSVSVGKATFHRVQARRHSIVSR